MNGAERLGAQPNSTLVMVGNFDGVHLGHQWVLRRGLEAAGAARLMPVVLTFHPHPLEVLGRGSLPVLTPLDRKVELLCRLSPELAVVVEPFTTELSAASPRCFAQGLLQERLGARTVMVGENFRFGHGRTGDAATLRELGRELGFEARAEALNADGGGVISSTRIRDLASAGKMEEAELLLGRPHALSGVVQHGDARARQLGVPSANLGRVTELLPARGVYAVLVDVLEGERYQKLGRGVANVGVRPTEGEGELRAEVHVLDFTGDLYARSLRVHLVSRLRDEQRFASVGELVAQLARDKRAAAERLRERLPDAAAQGAWH